MHLELLYCPYGTESSLKNPFNSDFALTTLEKSLKSGSDQREIAELVKTATQKKKDVIVRGVLSIIVIAAENLPKVDLMGKADPFVVLALKKAGNKSKTRVSFRFPATTTNYALYSSS